MSAPFLSGMFAAWAVSQALVGLFFVLAFTRGRREAEYLLFGLLSFVLSVATGGIALSYQAADAGAWLHAATLSHAGAIAAPALNLHFVMRYAQLGAAGRVAAGCYTLTFFYELLNLTGSWWQTGSVALQRSQLFGLELQGFSAQPRALSATFYGFAMLTLLLSVALLVRTYRSGKREALSSIIGATIVAAACLNDVLVLTNEVSHGLYLVPHAFSLYSLGVASTLLVRYRAAAGQLELTASSLKNATEELRHSHDELRQIQDELTTKQQLATVGELAAAIAHEVRNPLAVIVNAVAGLRRAGMSEDDRKVLLDIVDEEAARLNRLVTDLLRFARPVTVQRSAVSLVELAHRAESLAREGHSVSVNISDDPDVATVWVDPGLFRLVFDNLVENALQSMPGGGTVYIQIRRGEWNGASCVRVEIRDQGQGMEPEVLERAVDPFFTTRPSGTGLGLPIVQRIIEAHGGDIEIESEAGAGTSVILLLPMGEPEDVDVASRLRAAARA
jgi:signal transduction histidine kinase